MTRERIDRAVGYPYRAHGEDFLFTGGRAEPLPDAVAFDTLTPVVAVGSNRAPEQLARKFDGMAVSIPVTRVTARHVDVVHAAHMARYGAIPATLAPSEGTEVELWITWLDAVCLDHMDATESVGVNYDRVFVALEVVETRRAAPLRVLSYAARRGYLAFESEPVALAAVPARGRRFPALHQHDVLSRLHADHGRDEPFEDWLLAHIGEAGAGRRQGLTRSLAITAIRPGGGPKGVASD